MQKTAGQKLPYDPAYFKNKTVIFCLPGKSFNGQFLMNWTRLVQKCDEYGITIMYINCYNANVYYTRNMCLYGNILEGSKQRPFQGKIKYDYIMWVDDDILFSVDHFFKLLHIMEHRGNAFKVLTGLYPMANNTHYAAVRKLDMDYFQKNGKFEFLAKDDSVIEDKDLIQVEYTGFGFLLMRHGVLEAMDYPWFSPVDMSFKHPDTGVLVKDFTSEDVGFCLKLKMKLGIHIYAVSDVRVNHYKPVYL